MSAVLVAIFYLRVNSRTQAGIQDMRGALYMISSEVIYSSAYSVLYELPKEMPLYQRENSMYNPGVYYIATVIGLVICYSNIFLRWILIYKLWKRDFSIPFWLSDSKNCFPRSRLHDDNVFIFGFEKRFRHLHGISNLRYRSNNRQHSIRRSRFKLDKKSWHCDNNYVTDWHDRFYHVRGFLQYQVFYQKKSKPTI